MTKGVIAVARMKCDFDSTGVISDLHWTFTLIAIFSFISFMAAIPDFPNAFGVSFAIFLLSLSAFFLTSDLKCGSIYAFEDKVIIIHKFFGKKVFVSSIKYSDIRLAKYNIKTSGWGFIRYDIVLTIFKKSERNIRIKSKMNRNKYMPTEKPDEYKEYLNEHPMVKMCSFINERAEEI